VAALSLHALGAGLTDLPAGVVDYATEVRLHGDVFAAEPEAGSGPALEGRDVASVLESARAAGAELPAGARVMTSREWSPADGLIEVPLAVLVTGGSLVQCRNLDEASAERRAESERVTYRMR
jgi:uncharacterized protein (TIGR03089 family)